MTTYSRSAARNAAHPDASRVTAMTFARERYETACGRAYTRAVARGQVDDLVDQARIAAALIIREEALSFNAYASVS
jgi:hypothetical protein